MFVQIMTTHECYLPLAEKLNIPVIGPAAWPLFRRSDSSIGMQTNPSVIPLDFGEFSDQMTFFQRLKNTWEFLAIEYHYHFVATSRLNEIYDKFYPKNLVGRKQISLLFVNHHPSIMPRNLVPSAIDVGGIHVNPIKPLPQVFTVGLLQFYYLKIHRIKR